MKYPNITILALIFFLIGLSVSPSACNKYGERSRHLFNAKPDIIDAARAAGNFSTLLTALRAADLTETLRAPGPFTVLAPTDAAFGKMPPGRLEGLLTPQNKHQLAWIMEYHLLPGRVKAHAIAQRTQTATLAGRNLLVGTRDDTITVDNARLVTTDIICSNGIIHVIDAVLLPY